jgi:hypothetical protein
MNSQSTFRSIKNLLINESGYVVTDNGLPAAWAAGSLVVAALAVAAPAGALSCDGQSHSDIKSAFSSAECDAICASFYSANCPSMCWENAWCDYSAIHRTCNMGVTCGM